MGRTEIVTTEQVIGTFNMESFCPCPDPCVPCCGHDLCGCTGIPDEIFATFSAFGANPCACFTGTVPLTFDIGDGRWKTAGPVALGCTGNTIGIEFYCAPGGTTTSDLRIDLSGCTTIVNQPPGGTEQCSPLDVVFKIAVTNCCDVFLFPQALQIEITL